MRRRRLLSSVAPALAALVAPGTAVTLAGCVSLSIGDNAPAYAYLSLRDGAGAPVAHRTAPLVDALLIQAQPANALADTLSIVYSRREHEYAFYQLASWTERPVRQLPRLLQQRLEARNVAGAVGVLGDPLRADWLLGLAIETLHHDLRSSPGEGRAAIAADLFDRRTRARVAHRRFAAAAPAARADALSGVEAMSQAVGAVFDQLLPWLEAQLQRATAAAS